MSLVAIACPLCNESDVFFDVDVPNTDQHILKYGLIYAEKSKSEWKVCGQCGFVHQNPRPSIDALNKFYCNSQYHEPVTESDREKELEFSRWYFNEKIEFALNYANLISGVVFDIGCGKGGVLKLFEERGWKTYGVEPDKGLSNFARNVMKIKDVQQGIIDSNLKLKENVDLVFTNHAFEHFAELDEVMKGVSNILKPNGYLFIAIPTYYKNKSSLSKDWMNSSHYSLFTHNSLNNMLSRYGFEEVIHTYSGWKKEHDDLWYLAKFTGYKHDPEIYFEKPKSVLRYINIINPLRTLIFFPIYSHWPKRVQFYNRIIYAIKLFCNSPSKFLFKIYELIIR